MNSARRKLFKEGSNSWASETIVETGQNNEAVENGRTEIVEYTIVNEGDATLKEQVVENPHGLKTPQENVFRTVVPSFSEKDLDEKLILIVHEAEDERLYETWSEMKALEGTQVVTCHCTDLISVCTKETFLLIFLDMSSVAGNAQKICSTIRYNPNSLNRSVAIIGVTNEGSKENFGSHGINDIIHLPVMEETMNQVLLKWARQKSCEGMPLTPASPERGVQVHVSVSKCSEITKEKAEEPPPLGNYSPSLSLQQNCSNRISQTCSSVVTSESFCKPSFQGSQSEAGYQQLFHNGQCIPANRGSFVDLTQNHHLTNDGGLQQHTGHVSNVTAPQHFIHGGNHQDQTQSSLSLSRSASDHIPTTHGGLVSAHITGMVNPVYSEHCNQGYVYHNIQSSDPSRQSTFPQHFIPINPPPICPSAHVQNSGGFNAGHVASKVEHPAASTQAPPDCDGSKLVGTPAYMISGPLGSKDMKITLLHDDLSKHSSKERIRRERIKESCDQLRFLLPSVAGKKSDMASILEMTVKYVRMIKERLPPAVLQEITQNIADTTMILPRKRPNRDLTANTKQARPRLAPTANVQEGPPRLPHPFYMRTAPFQGKAPAMVTTTGPMYVPHLHIRPGHEHAQIPLQQHHVHQTEQASFRQTTSPPSAFNTCHTVGNIRGANVIQHHPPHDHVAMNLHQECSAPHSSFHPKHIYHGNHAAVPNVPSHSYDMPQQWSFLKLPPIGNIFHNLNSNNLCQESAKQDSCESGRSSPTDSSSMTPPLWESSGSLVGSRQSDHTHTESPIMFKGSSI